MLATSTIILIRKKPECDITERYLGTCEQHATLHQLLCPIHEFCFSLNLIYISIANTNMQTIHQTDKYCHVLNANYFLVIIIFLS